MRWCSTITARDGRWDREYHGMTIHLNGEPREIEGIDGCSVMELVERLGLGVHPVLVELDGKALLRKEFPDHQVAEGSRIEIVRMVAGG
mgnify:CR=1 FL=1